MDNPRSSFRNWLKQHRKADTALGDLARDVLADPSWPRGRESLDTYRDHMHAHGAIPRAIAVLERAWDQYRAQAPGTERTAPPPKHPELSGRRGDPSLD